MNVTMFSSCGSLQGIHTSQEWTLSNTSLRLIPISRLHISLLYLLKLQLTSCYKLSCEVSNIFFWYCLQEYLVSCARPSLWEYSVTVQSDQSQLALVEDIIREKLFLHLHREIPYVVQQVWAYLNLCGGYVV